jgi:ABC-type sugar transport system ATPase subunit
VDVGAQADIAARVRERAAGAGAGVIVAAADPQEVLQFADRVVVLHEGARTGELSAADVTPGRLAELMSGGRATDDEEGRGST